MDSPLRRITRRFMLAYLSLVSQTAACNRLHTIESRFARWVLMTHDRVEGDTFRLTREFLATMLGSQRPSVSLVASPFQQAGLIRYNRGQMTVLARPGLEDMSGLQHRHAFRGNLCESAMVELEIITPPNVNSSLDAALSRLLQCPGC